MYRTRRSKERKTQNSQPERGHGHDSDFSVTHSETSAKRSYSKLVANAIKSHDGHVNEHFVDRHKHEKHETSSSSQSRERERSKEEFQMENCPKRTHRKRKKEKQIADHSSIGKRFYYDREKKKYFKILPGHSNIVSAITNETIVRKRLEEKRLRDVELFLRGCVRKKSAVALPNLVETIFKQSQGDKCSSGFEASIMRTRVQTMRPLNSFRVSGSQLFAAYEEMEHMLLMDATPNFDKLIGMWSVQNSLVHRIQLVNITEQVRSGGFEPMSITADFGGATIIQTWNKVTHICWAPFENGDDCQRILYTTMCYTGDANSLAVIRNLDPDATSQDRFVDFNLGKKITWTCAWNRCSKQFSVGSEKVSLLLDVQTRRMWEYFSYKSDPLAQVFSRQTGQNLFTGTRRGQILTHDLRSISTRPTCCFNHNTSVCGLQLLQDDVSLVASDVSGKVSLWDMRMRRVLMEYKGGVNEYSRVPIHVDEYERIVYGAGQDGYTRFWCLKTGELLNTIPPPCSTTRETIPAVLYSQRWGDRNGNAGLLMGLKNKLHMYASPVVD
ncbi:hypothetical protein ScPMuIL_014386 [Solemya velum]